MLFIFKVYGTQFSRAQMLNKNMFGMVAVQTPKLKTCLHAKQAALIN